MNVRRLVKDLAVAAGDDYSQACKVLGMVVFALSEGVEPLLGGGLVRDSTFFRWMDLLRAAGWGELVCGTDYRRALEGILATRPSIGEALSPQALSHQASDAVKGLAGGREAEPSALDGVAAGGSPREATAPALAGGERARHE